MKATVLLPTTKERGVLLRYSVGSILSQSVKEIELFIIGDGVDESTRVVIHELMKLDSRIKFFDHPKGERRGETYRHQALMNHAQGEIVCYLLDRDLMMPDHIERMYRNLRNHNLCAHLSIEVPQMGTLKFVRKSFFGSRNEPKPSSLKESQMLGLLFSQVGHSLEFYKTLPHGWRTTPTEWPTDIYMWEQFLCQPGIRFLSTTDPTILYFKRGDHPGLSAAERAKELVQYFPLLDSPDQIEQLRESALQNSLLQREKLLLAPLLIKGQGINKFPLRLWKKLTKSFTKSW